MKASKGSAFEREFCKFLSRWWTAADEEPREDMFWRTAGSGGRATTRAKAGLTTSGGCGDITSTHPDSAPFSDVFTLELKRGYNRVTFHDLMDRPKKSKPSVMEQWVEQARDSAKAARTPFWWLVHKRDSKDAMVYLPQSMVNTWSNSGYRINVFVGNGCRVRYPDSKGKLVEMVAVRFAQFIEGINPEDVRDYAKHHKSGQKAKAD